MMNNTQSNYIKASGTKAMLRLHNLLLSVQMHTRLPTNFSLRFIAGSRWQAFDVHTHNKPTSNSGFTRQ